MGVVDPKCSLVVILLKVMHDQVGRVVHQEENKMV